MNKPTTQDAFDTPKVTTGPLPGPRRVMYRAEVGYTPEGELTLLSPNVRWATMG